MDLYAYANIGRLSEIAEANKIEVPRLRGYRLMSEESPIDITEELNCHWETKVAADLIRTEWRGSQFGFTYSSWTDFLIEYYIDGDNIRWDRIHGEKRRKLKFEIKKYKKRMLAAYSIYNKYCGRSDVLEIHARIGGWNWVPYGGRELEKQPWFLEKVDDLYDSTYCDIYAKIGDV